MSEAQLTLSVVIPCRNAAPFLPGLLDRLAAEDVSASWEVLVVDDGSTDGSLQIMHSFRDRIPLRVIQVTEGRGPGNARNLGVEQAAGWAIVFLDSDDLIAEGYLDAMLRALSSADLVSATLETNSLNPGWVGESRSLLLVDGFISDGFGFLPFTSGCMLGVRKDWFMQVGGFADMPTGEDVDFCWRAQLAGAVMKPVPEAILHYRYRDSLSSIFRQAWSYGRAQPALYRRFRRAGMPRRSLRLTYRDYRELARRLSGIRTKGQFANWMSDVLNYAGRIESSARNRVIYL